MSIWQRVRKFLKASVGVDSHSSPGANTEEPENPSEVHPTGEQTAHVAPEGGSIDSTALEVEICLQTDSGLVRTNNEDRGVYKRPGDPETAAKKGTLVIVADGMGGASAGEIASELAIRLIPDFYYGSAQAPALALKEALERASGEIHRTAQTNPELRGMGTTCVAVALLPPEVYMAYVGDSRLYLLRDQNLYQLSEDHSVVFDMVRKGILTRDQAKCHEERNVLSLSLGGRPEITASFWEKPMIARAGDRLLVCSDGLHDLVSDTEMQAIIADTPVDLAVHNLIATANLRGGLDNITAALIHIRPAQQEPVESPATREVMISST
jgi:protein phosphatase